MSRRGRLVAVLAVVVVVAAAVVVVIVTRGSDDEPTVTAAPSTTEPVTYAVGMTSKTLVDRSRATDANGSAPALPQRTLATTILYPARGAASARAVTGAAPAKKGGPYPLIAFAHGSFSKPEDYLALMTHWAAAGFVVAAPKFPLSSSGAPGGTDVGDVVRQPADMSFVISAVLRASADKSGPLAGMVDRREIGVAGHSLGGITAVGIAANSCCRDTRVKAAVIMAGTTQGYPGGTYHLKDAPPLLDISGTADDIVPYNQALGIFNRARGPKAMLTIKGGGHGSASGSDPTSSGSVLQASTDFFSAYLRGDKSARSRLAHDGAGPATMAFVPTVGSAKTIRPLPTPELHLKASATKQTDLNGGDVVTITWSGYTPGKAITILECGPENKKLDNSAACDFTHALLLRPNPTGSGSLPITIVEGPVGTSVCDAAHPGCFILVDNASSTVPADNVFLPISFAP